MQLYDAGRCAIPGHVASMLAGALVLAVTSDLAIACGDEPPVPAAAVNSLRDVGQGVEVAAIVDVKKRPVYGRLRAAIDAVRAIDTHDHLRPVDELPSRRPGDNGVESTLCTLLRGSYLPRIANVPDWSPDRPFNEWWASTSPILANVRAAGFYRYMLPAYRDLYGVDFDDVSADEAAQLSDRIAANHRSADWVEHVVVERANIELMLVDPFWARTTVVRTHRFVVPVLRVDTWITGSHPSRFDNPLDSPYVYAERAGLPMETFDDYLAAVDACLERGRAADAVCLKTGLAYQRDLSFAQVSADDARRAYGRAPSEVSDKEQRDFEDFIFWRICALSVKHDLPLQIHTGNARVQGSNPLLLVDVIAGNPDTKFVLFHGGYPWVGETGAIAMRHRNVWIDSNWLPQISYTMAKRAFQEWLEVVPADRILWGGDNVHVEGIYGATVTMRRCLAESLAEKVERGELRENDAARIGRQIMRENALSLFPRLNRMRWRDDRLD